VSFMYKHYTMKQVILPLDLEIIIPEDDIAHAINRLIESIPAKVFKDFLRETGRPAYHPRMMLKIILCGYTQSVFSGRKIEALLEDSVRMMWLAQGYKPSYRTINRFRSNPLIENILRECFVQFRNQLVLENLIEEEAIFIDGTKIEANANKFTFVWRKSVERYSQKLTDKSNQKYNELLEKEIIPALERESEEELTLEEMKEVVKKLDDKLEEYNKAIEACEVSSERKKLRLERKLPKQAHKQFFDFITRKQKYEKDMKLFGDRNSYSKTDPDATFMRMKDDYMNNGQLKAGYNVQIATEGQYALAYDVFWNPTDTRTLIPFLDTIEESFFELPEYIVADAGYGSEQNYEDILEKRKRTPLITYNQYRTGKKKKHKENAFHVDNWEYNEQEDTFLCPNSRKLWFSHYSKRTDRYGFTREFKVYECEDCSDCQFRDLCTKAQEGKNRTIYINEKWENQKEYIKDKLSDEKTGEIYGKRKIDVEPVFGFLKANLRFCRFSVRGKTKVKNELGFALMAVNLRKYTAINGGTGPGDKDKSVKKGSKQIFLCLEPFIYCFRLVLSQPLFYASKWFDTFKDCLLMHPQIESI
jgi:transposase